VYPDSRKVQFKRTYNVRKCTGSTCLNQLQITYTSPWIGLTRGTSSKRYSIKMPASDNTLADRYGVARLATINFTGNSLSNLGGGIANYYISKATISIAHT